MGANVNPKTITEKQIREKVEKFQSHNDDRQRSSMLLRFHLAILTRLELPHIRVRVRVSVRVYALIGLSGLVFFF